MHNSPDSPTRSPASPAPSPPSAASAPRTGSEYCENRRWWIKLFLQPLSFLLCGVLLIVGLGAAQRFGWISAGGVGGNQVSAQATSAGGYVCAMFCTPPLSEPGRCPVCDMELVPASAAGASGDRRSVRIDPAARRLANIHTVSVISEPLTRTIRAVGELNYNEGSLKTISAYVDSRLERLYADYTGIVVETGDHLALLYSPKLYSAQVEYLSSRKAHGQNRPGDSQRFSQLNHDLAENAKQRLIELGMTPQQIEELERAGQASSRLHLSAPSSGTVIEKLAVEGEYVRQGEPIYRLADLSTLWLMLKLFPEDASAIRYGQKVQAQVQSLPGRTFAGRVAFIDPNVDPKTRTVGVRVVMPNVDGLIRAGDFARATVEVPLGDHGRSRSSVYDSELASRWISPRHPHVVESAPGKCRECGVDLVPAAQFGFTDDPEAHATVLTVPRDAVLMAGDHSVLYVETEPGRFEIRQVVLGPGLGDRIVIADGINDGEQVATRGNFLIDSQMQLAGNPSLIDPHKAQPRPHDAETEKIMLALEKLAMPDREAATQQRICPVTTMRLGLMGTPPKVAVSDQHVFLCCIACEGRLLEEPEKYLTNLAQRGEEEEAPQSEETLR